MLTTKLLTAALTVAAGHALFNKSHTKTYQAFGFTTAGAGAASIEVQGSMDRVHWDVIGTINLTLSTTHASDSFTSDDRYMHIRGNVVSISGTNASVDLTMGH